MEHEHIGIFEAKTHFSEIIEKVVREGRSVIITRRGEPMVEISPSRENAAHARMTKEEALAALKELRDRTTKMSRDGISELVQEGRDRCSDL